MNNSWYYEQLEKIGALEVAKAWLKKNPPPKDWKGSEWAWAYTEMAIFPGTVISPGPWTL